MSELIHKQQEELAEIIEQYTIDDGSHQTAIPGLFFSRYSHAIGPSHGVHNTSLCIVAQGKKEIWLAQERYEYSPTDYLITSVNLPITGQVMEASPEIPYLGLKLEFTHDQILEVLRNSDIATVSKEKTERAMYVNRINSSMVDAVIRLVRLLDSPEDIPVIAPLFIKEILYRVLQGQHGGMLKQAVVQGSSTYRIRDIIEHIINHYNSSFRSEELANLANMSVPSFYRHFKEVTAMSPIQFQKQIRLQEARRLLLSESTDAADVSFRVGYESPSQFSREYSRMFGFPPIEDIKRLRVKA
ncbi:AraC-like DNA-binding protein [Peribacillus deserti]|uniref:AraC-like DNA-binding protein n=1 Tax=Peribacillus deserti TaxID=673318 RepID=A0ABS2QMI1_9BACI|nr:AraC family transcriptional regulator [Peribacillus deserti]MBM7694317.1 AraC-like DNA-binding protein [Peribacillus deserti]